MDISDSLKDGSSKLNNHTAMTVVTFILALSDQIQFRFVSYFKVGFSYGLHENDMKLNYKNLQMSLSVSLRYE